MSVLPHARLAIPQVVAQMGLRPERWLEIAAFVQAGNLGRAHTEAQASAAGENIGWGWVADWIEQLQDAAAAQKPDATRRVGDWRNANKHPARKPDR